MNLHLDTTMFILLSMSMAFDWIVQTNEEATKKFTDSTYRILHAFKYATLTFVLILLFGYSFQTSAMVWSFLFTTHFVIDDRRLVLWIMRAKGIEDQDMKSMWWMQIAIDQWLHMIVNLILSVLTYYHNVVVISFGSAAG